MHELRERSVADIDAVGQDGDGDWTVDELDLLVRVCGGEIEVEFGNQLRRGREFEGIDFEGGDGERGAMRTVN